MDVFGDPNSKFCPGFPAAEKLKLVSGLSDGQYGLSCRDAFRIYLLASMTVLRGMSVFMRVGSFPPCGDNIYSSMEALEFCNGHWY